MSLSYCVGLVYRHTVLFVRGVELSNDVEADALVKLSVKRSDRRQIVTYIYICIYSESSVIRAPLVKCHKHFVRISEKFG